ncbi:uncharacterized protein LAESUDRAFT_719696 [Laetiporus sulphureus 93-53]|uniref:Uncharacterized protein n=1 Tax=Laetiporus sulphureus 93-53 TaxID=1314785 RepID=A0A165HHZ7_9APHY|nr:uncharacterized protein LAESUDRAFT_719696 [Laetiporus sulphureus 93-53]KZT11755.1 hypothetical protein LAESUDRAFT_719696 [Laetiporus sulphureus 93-53]
MATASLPSRLDPPCRAAFAVYATIPNPAAVARIVFTPRAMGYRRMRVHKMKRLKLPIQSDATERASHRHLLPATIVSREG